jgi:hypothetical protein
MPSTYPALIPRRHGEDAIANMRDVRQTIAANKNGDRISKKLDQTWPSIYKRVFPAPLEVSETKHLWRLAKAGGVAASQHLRNKLHQTPLIKKNENKFLHSIGILYCSRINQPPFLLFRRVACAVWIRRFQWQERSATCPLHAGARSET